MDREVLVGLFRVTDGLNWIEKENWDTGAELSQWHGVKVNQGRVVELKLPSNRLQGFLEPISDTRCALVMPFGTETLTAALVLADCNSKKLRRYFAWRQRVLIEILWWRCIDRASHDFFSSLTRNFHQMPILRSWLGDFVFCVTTESSESEFLTETLVSKGWVHTLDASISQLVFSCCRTHSRDAGRSQQARAAVAQ